MQIIDPLDETKVEIRTCICGSKYKVTYLKFGGKMINRVFEIIEDEICVPSGEHFTSDDER